MIPELAQKSPLYSFLFKLDVELYEQTKQAGCPHCEDGRLDDGFYERHPKGGPDDLPDELRERRSLCCAKQGCRKRTLPPSCLYLGRKLYWKAVILVVLACRQKRENSWTYEKLQARFGVSRSTIWRWANYFEEFFSESDEWKKRRGYVVEQIDRDSIPGAVWEIFREVYDDLEEAMGKMVQFLSADPERLMRDERLTQKSASFQEI